MALTRRLSIYMMSKFPAILQTNVRYINRLPLIVSSNAA